MLTFTATDDATVREDRPTRNLGSDPVLEVDGSRVKDFLLRFDVTGIGGSPVANATLRLFAVDGSSSGGDFFKVTDTNWDQNSVNWATAPAGNGGSLGSWGQVEAGNWYELDVTSLITGDGPVSTRTTSLNPNGADYSSLEGPVGQAPQLVVTLQ